MRLGEKNVPIHKIKRCNIGNGENDVHKMQTVRLMDAWVSEWSVCPKNMMYDCRLLCIRVSVLNDGGGNLNENIFIIELTRNAQHLAIKPREKNWTPRILQSFIAPLTFFHYNFNLIRLHLFIFRTCFHMLAPHREHIIIFFFQKLLMKGDSVGQNIWLYKPIKVKFM